MLGEKQVMEVLIVDKGTEQHRSVSSPPVVSLRWTETRAQRKGEVSNAVCMEVTRLQVLFENVVCLYPYRLVVLHSNKEALSQ